MGLVTWAAQEAERRLSAIGSRWAHTQGVVHRARALESLVPPADRPLLVAGAYLHDIGYAPELRASGFHPLDGALWLGGQGLERLACLVAHHSGARFEAHARGLGAALDAFPEEQSVSADVLTYCDLTTDTDGREVTPPVRLAEIQHRYGADSDVSRGLNAASTALDELVARMAKRIENRSVCA